MQPETQQTPQSSHVASNAGHDGRHESPPPGCGHNRDRQDEIAEMLGCTTTALQRDDLIAEYVKLEREKVGQVDQPGGRQKKDKGIANAARRLEFLGDSQEARRKLIERALQVAAICPEAKEAAIAAKLQNNHSALRAIAKAKLEGQVEKVHEIAQRKRTAGTRKDEAASDFSALVRDLLRRIGEEKVERFAETGISADQCARLGKFFTELANLKGSEPMNGQSNGNDEMSAEESARRRKREHEDDEMPRPPRG